MDNPAWYSLTETHHHFAIDYKGTKFYHPAYCPFGGYTDAASCEAAIDAYALLTGNFYLIGDKPIFSDKVGLNKELVCDQMILDKNIDIGITAVITELTTSKQKTDLFELVNFVQPGYFKNNTADLGNYYGIYLEDILVAVTGERMKMDSFTEVSAVVTHPEHAGKGYAKQLVAYTCNSIFAQNKIPYLHVADTNTAAIKLYEKLGFVIRRKMSFWNFLVQDENV